MRRPRPLANVAIDQVGLTRQTTAAYGGLPLHAPTEAGLPWSTRALTPAHYGGTADRGPIPKYQPSPHLLPVRPSHRGTATAAVPMSPPGQRASRSGQCRQPPSSSDRLGSEDPSSAPIPSVAGLGSQETLAKRRPSGKVPRLPALAPDRAGPRGPALPGADSGGSRSPEAPPPCRGTRDGMHTIVETPFDATQRRGCCHLRCPSSCAFPALLETNTSRVSNVPPALRVDGTLRRNETIADHLRTTRMRRAGDLHVSCGRPSIQPPRLPACSRCLHLERAELGRPSCPDLRPCVPDSQAWRRSTRWHRPPRAFPTLTAGDAVASSDPQIVP
jgi:hypothetical protein